MSFHAVKTAVVTFMTTHLAQEHRARYTQPVCLMLAVQIPSQELLMAEEAIQGGPYSHARPGESYADVLTPKNENNPSTYSVVPRTVSPIQ